MASWTTRTQPILDQDVADGYGEVYLPYVLEREYPTVHQEWSWPKSSHAWARSGTGAGNRSRDHNLGGSRQGEPHPLGQKPRGIDRFTQP
jgi:hypothetical protein